MVKERDLVLQKNPKVNTLNQIIFTSTLQRARRKDAVEWALPRISPKPQAKCLGYALKCKAIIIDFMFQLSQTHLLPYAFKINILGESPLGFHASWDQLMSLTSLFPSKPLAWAKLKDLKRGKLVLLQKLVKEHNPLNCKNKQFGN